MVSGVTLSGMDTHEVLSLCCQSALTSNHNHKYQIIMKKTETLYSYLYKKSNKMWAVKYKFHKKDTYKNASLGTRNKREAESIGDVGDSFVDFKI